MDREPRTASALRAPDVQYAGKPFAPATGTYLIGDTKRINLSTRQDSGYAPNLTKRIADLGRIAPLALAALWESAFAYEAGPLSTWNN